MNKKYIITAVVIALVFVYGVFLRGDKSLNGIPMNETPQEQEQATTSATTLPVAHSVTKTTTTTSAPKASSVTILKDGSYLVSYTDRGFVPATLEIKTGKSVHFVNNSNKAMSLTTTEPNSQIYGEFNQGKTVGKGGSYDFTFLQSGVWSYVNRNNQVDKGVVIVK
ncbi:MAG: cupredoxin domain-containing protein [Candidatus Yonathbacteria bacterium]|nr:cupredoxin domain-containing protein [Candidatus Yonathbacteria bacterium]